jgi:acetylornithine/succinyldiaminopimelate/putrescine aminotransferase
MEKLIFLLHMLKGNKNFHGHTLFFIKWTWPEKYVNQNFDERWVVHNLNQHVQKVCNLQHFENSYI